MGVAPKKLKDGAYFSPLVTATLLAILAGFLSGEAVVFSAILFGAIIGGYLAFAIFSLPMYFLLFKFSKVTMLNSTIVGLLSTLLLTLLIESLFPVSPRHGNVTFWQGFLNISIFMAPCGIVGGFLVWLLGVRKRPVHGSE